MNVYQLAMNALKFVSNKKVNYKVDYELYFLSRRSSFLVLKKKT